MSNLLFGLVYFSYFRNNYFNHQIFQNISILTFVITYKPLSYVMAEVKHIPSTVNAPPAILLQVRKFYEVIFCFKFYLLIF